MIRVRYLTVFIAPLLMSLLFSAPLPVHGMSQEDNISTAYVSKILDGTVAVIDVSTDRIIAVLAMGTNPAEIAVVNSVDRAYVADLSDGTLTVINTTAHRIEETIDLGYPVAAVDADQATQTVYALEFSNGSPGTKLHVIDANTNIQTADVSIGSRLQNIALDPEENRAYATDFVDGVIVIDTSNLTVVTSLPILDLPHGVAIHPGLNRLYVTQLESDTVTIIDTTSHAVIDTLSVGDTPQWIKLDMPRNKAFVTNEGDGTVSVIDLSSNTVRPGTIPVGLNPLTLTVHEAAAKAYVYNIGDGTISVIDTINETVIATIDVIFSDGFEPGDTTAWSMKAP